MIIRLSSGLPDALRFSGLHNRSQFIEFADYGIKILNDEVTLGATVDGGCAHTPYFAEFGSSKANDQFLSLDNPLNKYVIDLLLEMIVLDE